MFTLNLIRDRAMARARRRVVVFISTIIFLAGLIGTGIIVYYYIEEKQATDNKLKQIADLKAQNSAYETKHANWKPLRDRLNFEITAYNDVRQLVDNNRRPLLTPVLTSLSRMVADNSEEPGATNRWFKRFELQRDNMLQQRTANDIGILRPMSASGMMVVAVVGTEMENDSQRRDIEAKWRDIEALTLRFGFLSAAPGNSKSFPLAGQESAGPSSGEKQWLFEYSLTTNLRNMPARTID